MESALRLRMGYMKHFKIQFSFAFAVPIFVLFDRRGRALKKNVSRYEPHVREPKMLWANGQLLQPSLLPTLTVMHHFLLPIHSATIPQLPIFTLTSPLAHIYCTYLFHLPFCPHLLQYRLLQYKFRTAISPLQFRPAIFIITLCTSEKWKLFSLSIVLYCRHANLFLLVVILWRFHFIPSTYMAYSSNISFYSIPEKTNRVSIHWK